MYLKNNAYFSLIPGGCGIVVVVNNKVVGCCVVVVVVVVVVVEGGGGDKSFVRFVLTVILSLAGNDKCVEKL